MRIRNEEANCHVRTSGIATSLQPDDLQHLKPPTDIWQNHWIRFSKVNAVEKWSRRQFIWTFAKIRSSPLKRSKQCATVGLCLRLLTSELLKLKHSLNCNANDLWQQRISLVHCTQCMIATVLTSIRMWFVSISSIIIICSFRYWRKPIPSIFILLFILIDYLEFLQTTVVFSA